MRKSIDLLLSKLEANQISKHIICPSANSVLPELRSFVKDVIEIIDERSAGYVATGMCEEIDAPVVIWCADNDSYRNLTSALTEAYYRKLPILVVALTCDANINQAINPQDTIRYYSNNTIAGSRGTVADIEHAIEYLSEEVKGPVYLSLGPYSEDPNNIYKTEDDSHKIDVTAIANFFPSNACVHFGSGISCECDHLKDFIFRTDHITKDGNLSMLIGSSLVERSQLHIGVFTSEEVTYDLNMFGNRHVDTNLVVIVLTDANQSSAIFNFASRMQWNCKKVAMTDLNAIKESLVISDKPQYIEVAL